MIDRTENLAAAGVTNVGVVSNPEFWWKAKRFRDRSSGTEWWSAPGRTKILPSCAAFTSGLTRPMSKYIEVNPRELRQVNYWPIFYLFNKLAVCFDVIGRTCEAFDDVQFEQIRKIQTTDPRIGNWGSMTAFTLAAVVYQGRSLLSHQLQTAGVDAVLVNETYLANKRQLDIFLGRAKKEAGFDWANKTIALFGTAFKRDTNDIRNSPSINMVHTWQENNAARIVAYDPAAVSMFSQLFPPSAKLQYATREADAIQSADAVVIATDWPQFRGLADLLLAQESRPLVMDGRRMLQHRYDDLQKAGFDIMRSGVRL